MTRRRQAPWHQEERKFLLQRIFVAREVSLRPGKSRNVHTFNNDIDALNVPDGELIYNKTKTKAPLSKKHLLSSLTQYFKGDQRMIDELSKFIMESRAEKEKESIRRKIKKNKN